VDEEVIVVTRALCCSNEECESLAVHLSLMMSGDHCHLRNAFSLPSERGIFRLVGGEKNERQVLTFGEGFWWKNGSLEFMLLLLIS
jgi:hypothetical protein